MPINTFNCETEELTNELFLTCSTHRIKFGTIPTGMDISHLEGVFLSNAFRAATTDKKLFRTRGAYRVILIPDETDPDKPNIKIHITPVLDIAQEFNIQLRFQKSPHLVIYKALLYDLDSLFVYRKTEMLAHEKVTETQDS